MISMEMILLGVVLPAGLAAGIALLGRLLSRWLRGSWEWALGLGVGFVVGYLALNGPVRFPPRMGVQWVVFEAMVLSVAAVGYEQWGRRMWGRVVASVLVMLFVVTAVTWRLVPGTWGQWEAWGWRTGMAAGAVSIWLVLDAVARELPARWFGLIMGILAGGSATVIGLTGSQTMGQELGILASAVGGAWAVSLFRRDGRALCGVAVLVPIWSHYMVAGHFLSSMHKLAWNSITLAAAPLLAGLVLLPLLAKLGQNRRAWLAVGLVTIPVVIAVLRAWMQFREDASEMMGW